MGIWGCVAEQKKPNSRAFEGGGRKNETLVASQLSNMVANSLQDVRRCGGETSPLPVGHQRVLVAPAPRVRRQEGRLDPRVRRAHAAHAQRPQQRGVRHELVRRRRRRRRLPRVSSARQEPPRERGVVHAARRLRQAPHGVGELACQLLPVAAADVAVGAHHRARRSDGGAGQPAQVADVACVPRQPHALQRHDEVSLQHVRLAVRKLVPHSPCDRVRRRQRRRRRAVRRRRAERDRAHQRVRQPVHRARPPCGERVPRRPRHLRAVVVLAAAATAGVQPVRSLCRPRHARPPQRVAHVAARDAAVRASARQRAPHLVAELLRTTPGAAADADATTPAAASAARATAATAAPDLPQPPRRRCVPVDEGVEGLTRDAAA
eukprot:Rhum_TRINITY_DN15245_c5_g3::Rhum_TRINITY_DN15245_c5_g3_i1::g.146863::m.146863